MNGKGSLWQRLLCAFFPDRCSVCGEVVEMGRVICSDCQKNLFSITGKICHRCGAGVDDHTEKECEKISAEIIAAYYYRDNVRHLIIDFKDTLRNEYFDLFSLDFFEKLATEYSGISFDLAVCVPVSDKKKGTSKIICRQTAKRFLITCDTEVLEKYRETQKQHRLSAEERKTNLINSIRVKHGKESVVNGKTVILFDDVKTTGATLDECTKALYEAGAKAVYCACIAVSDYGLEHK